MKEKSLFVSFLRLGYLRFIDNLFSNVIIIVYITIILTIINLLMGLVNNSKMLYETYENLYHPDSVLFSEIKISEENGKTVVRQFDPQNYKNIVGLDKVLKIEEALCKDKNGKEFMIRIVPDEIMDYYNLPLIRGRMPKSGALEAVMTCNNNFNLGENAIIGTDEFNINIVGELTQKTYLPNIGAMGMDTSYMDLYDIVNEETLYTYMLVRSSQAENLPIERYNTSANAILTFTAKTEYELGAAYKYLSQNGEFYSLGSLRTESETVLAEQTKWIPPIIVCISILSIIGILAVSAVLANKHIRENAVYFICGCSYLKLFLITILTFLIIGVLSLILTLAVFSVCSLFNAFAVFGIVFKLNNVIITLGTTGLLLLISLIIPFVSFKAQSPVKILKNN